MVATDITAAGSLNGGVAMLTAVTAPTTATAPPMPIASAATTAAENAGSPTTRRTATTTSRRSASSHGSPAKRAVGLAHLVDTAEVALRRQARFMPGQPAGLVGRSQGVEVGPDLFVEARVAAPRDEDDRRARDPQAVDIGYSCSSSRPTMATVRAQRSCSAPSCFRPAAVMA